MNSQRTTRPTMQRGVCTSPIIGVIGSGAIGGFYGCMLVRAGFDVHFLLRSNYDAVARDGWRIESERYGDTTIATVNAYNSYEHMPRCDWLLIAAKTTGNRQLGPTLRRVAKDGAMVLSLQNGLETEARLREMLPPTSNLFGAPCMVCVQSVTPRVIRHILLGDITIGYHSGRLDAGRRSRALAAFKDVFQAAGIDVVPTDDLARARWEKLAWNIPFNGLCALLGVGTKRVLDARETRALLRIMIEEVRDAARGCGICLPSNLAETMLRRSEQFPDFDPSMLTDLRSGRPMELAAIYGQPIKKAKDAGHAMPMVSFLHGLLRWKQGAPCVAGPPS